jgi:NADH dehydrogenase
VAQNIKRLIHKKEMKPFRYKDKGSMATVGRNRAVVDLIAFKIQGLYRLVYMDVCAFDFAHWI